MRLFRRASAAVIGRPLVRAAAPAAPAQPRATASSSGLEPREPASEPGGAPRADAAQDRWPSSVSVSPTRRRSASLGVRVTRPSRSSRSTCFDIAAAEMRSRAARSRTPIPGVYLIATRRATCSGEAPPARVSRRSSRLIRSSTGRRPSATARVSVWECLVVLAISLTRFRIIVNRVNDSLKSDNQSPDGARWLFPISCRLSPVHEEGGEMQIGGVMRVQLVTATAGPDGG